MEPYPVLKSFIPEISPVACSNECPWYIKMSSEVHQIDKPYNGTSKWYFGKVHCSIILVWRGLVFFTFKQTTFFIYLTNKSINDKFQEISLLTNNIDYHRLSSFPFIFNYSSQNRFKTKQKPNIGYFERLPFRFKNAEGYIRCSQN